MRTARAVRTIAGAVIAVAVVVAVVFVVSRSTDSGSAAPVTTASPLSPQTITRGDLVRTSKADGTLEYSDTLIVWHRIAGQQVMASTGTSGTANGANSSANGQANGPAGAQGGGPSGGATRAVHEPSQATTPSTPGGPSTTTCTPSSSTTAPPSSSAPGTVDPAAVDPCSTPGGGNSGGAARPGGGAASGGVGTSAQTARITQTVTSITSVGRTIANGDVLYTINSEPVIALTGALPAWRTLSTSSPAGADIAQLEQALVDLGYDAAGTVTVDETFDSKTAAMVKRWQVGLGITASGRVALGSVVFIPHPSTVASVARTVGDEVGDADEMLTLAGRSQRIIIDVPTGDEEHWEPGLSVAIGTASGKVAVLQSVSRNSTAVVQAVIVPDVLVEGVENGSTVTVSAALLIAQNVLIVPSQALVSRVDGTYAVQVVDGSGQVSWTQVTLEGVAGQRAGVLSAELEDGATVLAPSA